MATVIVFPPYAPGGPSTPPDIEGVTPVIVENAEGSNDFTVRLDPNVALVEIDGGTDIIVTSDPNAPNKFVVDYAGPSSGAVTVSVVAVSPASVNVGNPKLVGGVLYIDGRAIIDDDPVLLPNQFNPVENGVRIYDQDTNTLGRPDFYASGSTVKQPFYVDVGDDGVTFGGSTWALASPAQAVVDTDATTWINADTGAGLQGAGTALMGPYQPYYGPRVATPRGMTAMDMPTDRARSSATRYFPRTNSRANSRVGYVSDYIDPGNIWSNASALTALFAEFNTLYADRPLGVYGAVVVPSGKRLEFTGSGRKGPTKIIQYNPASSVFVFDNSADIDLRGTLVIEYFFRSTSAVKALRATNVSRLRIDALETIGVDYAINFAGALDDILIGSVGVDNPADNQVPLFIAQSGTTGQESVRCQRVRNQPNVTVVTNANKAYTPHIDGRVLVYSGAMTANRAVTLATNNHIGSGEFRVSHQATGGFSIDALGLKTITNGQTAHISFSGDGVATLLG